jgi:hypothetical protein
MKGSCDQPLGDVISYWGCRKQYDVVPLYVSMDP